MSSGALIKAPPADPKTQQHVLVQSGTGLGPTGTYHQTRRQEICKTARSSHSLAARGVAVRFVAFLSAPEALAFQAMEDNPFIQRDIERRASLRRNSGNASAIEPWLRMIVEPPAR